MKQIFALWCAFAGFAAFGQAEASEDDYLFQTINIFETTVLNELVKYASNCDSIQLLAGSMVYTVDTTLKVLSFSEAYAVKHARTDHRIKRVKTDLVSARFQYNKQGQLTDISFTYSRKVRVPLYEGTTDHYTFEYAEGRLIQCVEFGVYSNDHPEMYLVRYY